MIAVDALMSVHNDNYALCNFGSEANKEQGIMTTTGRVNDLAHCGWEVIARFYYVAKP